MVERKRGRGGCRGAVEVQRKTGGAWSGSKSRPGLFGAKGARGGMRKKASGRLGFFAQGIERIEHVG